MISIGIVAFNAPSFAANSEATGAKVNIGIIDQFPLAYKNEAGEHAGFIVDLLSAMAAQENWRVEFHLGTLDKLQLDLLAGDLDILAGVPHSMSLNSNLNFSEESFLDDWGVVYKRFDNNRINSVFDLAGKTIGVVPQSFHAREFAKLMAAFKIKFKPKPFASSEDLRRALRAKEIDAAVFNRLYFLVTPAEKELVSTTILFAPADLRFAALLNKSASTLSALDWFFREQKKNKKSLYYATMSKWVLRDGKAEEEATSRRYLLWGLIALPVVLLVLLILWRVQTATKSRLKQTQIALEDSQHQSKLFENELNHIAFYDSLTGLANRRLLLEKLRDALVEAARTKTKVAVLSVNIDHFQDINNRFGHHRSDLFIKTLSERLLECCRDSDLLARVGGDEFVFLMSAVDGAGDSHYLAERALKAAQQPFSISGHDIYASVSIGIAVYPDDAHTQELLLRYSNSALTNAKQNGRGNYKFYSREMTESLDERLSIEADLRKAIEEQQFVLYYQPIINLKSHAAVGVEALIRWHHPVHGMLTPDHFIEVAESTGLIVQIGEWALKQACMDIKDINDKLNNPIRVAVNLSLRQFESDQILRVVDQALSASLLAPKFLELELTESMFMQDVEFVKNLINELVARGVAISIDDFGTGYSSLNYLKQLPIDTVKIDKSFTQDVPSVKENAELAATIIAMAHGLGCRVIAEGVNDQQQMNFLVEKECDEVQGHLFCPPCGAHHLYGWLKSRT